MTRTNNQALQFDEADQPVEAADSYEMMIRDGSARLHDYMNLLALYFVSLDYGYATAHKISSQFADFAFQRVNELPAKIAKRFGVSHESIFWQEYTLFVILGDEPDEEKWREYVESGTTVVPLIYFGTDVVSGKYAKQLTLLRQAIASENTIRSRYIKSVLESNAS